jgi:hypothetical protein
LKIIIFKYLNLESERWLVSVGGTSGWWVGGWLNQLGNMQIDLQIQFQIDLQIKIPIQIKLFRLFMNKF